jgi:hypothetical protein
MRFKTLKIYIKMKKINILLLILTISLSTFYACQKEIVEPTKAAYTPADLDVKGGTWKTYILAAPTDITLAAPKDISSPEYTAELTKLKAMVGTLTTEQKTAVTYWGAGAVYRWNEIARELCARYNLAPVAGLDGKYPVPNADSTKKNPNYYPKFPFANPPYSSRALASLSVAQYDALVAAWSYKYKYNRLAPSKYDASIATSLPVTALPSYPSEDAVVAGASYTVLAAMFPGEIAFLDAKLLEHKNSRYWAGMNVESDVTAGETFGKSVAAKIMARAKTDGMSAANNQTLTAGMIDNAKKLGTTEVWVSQESPARPPMLPAFGFVTPWNFDKTITPTLRPSAPPAIGSDEYKKNLDELVNISKKQTREQARIASYWSDGAGSYTPPGHWHRTAANLCYDNKYSEIRTARTLALLGTALMDAGISCWDTKYNFYYPRPQQMDKSIKTTVGVPNFPSYTSGHSTFSAAAATVLSYVFPAQSGNLDAQAKEASESRIYGLIHYRFDCERGLEVGKKVGAFAVTRGKGDGSGF